MLTGWQELEWSGGKNWFYFDKNKGTLLSGWQELEWSGGKDWFYFDPMNGYLIQDKCITISGKTYCFTKDGVCNKGC
jgi:glucan-binding YG repeat protein